LSGILTGHKQRFACAKHLSVKNCCSSSSAHQGWRRSSPLRFHGESYGREAQCLKRGDLVLSRGGFVIWALAVEWAKLEQVAMENR
jgi:hypothetical protein